MQSVEQRDITKTDTGRASLAILLVQDVAVIPILAIIPLLAVDGAARRSRRSARTSLEAVDNPDRLAGWRWLIIGGFVAAMLGSPLSSSAR